MIKIQFSLLLTGILMSMDNSGKNSVHFEDTSADIFFNLTVFYFAHTTKPSLRRQPYCDCKLASISFSALFVRERISTEITHHDKRGRPVAQIGSWWCNWMQKLFAPPTQQNLIPPSLTTTTTTKSQGRRKRAKSEQPTNSEEGS